jgi:Phosphoribosyl-ATP pyrophosphohydrolase
MKTEHQIRVNAMLSRIRELGNLEPLPSKPTVPPDKMILSQARLILEEVLEVFEACGLSLVWMPPESSQIGKFELFPHTPGSPIEITEVAKELADLSVVTTGMFSEFGMSDQPILEAVDTNNLGKFGPGGYLDERRKWRKPPNYPKPDIARVLRDQGWDPEVEDE